MVSLLGCEQDAIEPSTNTSPVVKIIGKPVDTAFINTYYKDPGAYVNDINCQLIRNSELKVSGQVNTSALGIYFLDYDYTDANGKKATTVTRTVNVLENTTSFLTGNYHVVCSFTASTPSSTSVAINEYTTVIFPSPYKNQFEIVQLKIGAEFVIPVARLNNNLIHLEFYRNGNCSATGTLSPSKNTFTIQSKIDEALPTVSYTCKNIFTKQQLINIVSNN